MKHRIIFWAKTLGLIGLVFSVLFFSEGRPLEISLSMKTGETLAVIGSNGAGKSTLLWAPFRDDPSKVGAGLVR